MKITKCPIRNSFKCIQKRTNIITDDTTVHNALYQCWLKRTIGAAIICND